MNTESKLFKELSEQELDKLVYFHFGNGVEYSAKLLSGGLFNTTYRISLLSNKKEFILRVGPANTHLLLPFEHNLMRAEEHVYNLLSESEIPCSHVLVCDTSKTIIDRDFMIVDCIYGIALSELKVSDDIKAKIYNQVGMYVSKIHKITALKFGRIAEILEGKGYDLWSEFLGNEFAVMCKILLEQSLISANEADLFGEVIENHKALLDEVEIPHLIHADLWAGNILVSKNRDNYEVAAIIDADRAVFGDIDFEFASPWIINEDFIAGYGQSGDIASVDSEKSKVRKDIYRLLYSLIDTYVWAVEYNNPNNSLENKENALQQVARL